MNSWWRWWYLPPLPLWGLWCVCGQCSAAALFCYIQLCVMMMMMTALGNCRKGGYISNNVCHRGGVGTNGEGAHEIVNNKSRESRTLTAYRWGHNNNNNGAPTRNANCQKAKATRRQRTTNQGRRRRRARRSFFDPQKRRFLFQYIALCVRLLTNNNNNTHTHTHTHTFLHRGG